MPWEGWKGPHTHSAGYLGPLRIIGYRPGIGPVSVEYGLALNKDFQRFRLFVVDNTLRSGLSNDLITNKGDRLDRWRLGHQNLAGTLIEDTATMGPDELQHVTYQPLVLLELCGVYVEGGIAFSFEYNVSLGEHLMPRFRRVKFIFFQQVFSVVKKTCVEITRNAVDSAMVGIGSDGCRQECFLLFS